MFQLFKLYQWTDFFFFYSYNKDPLLFFCLRIPYVKFDIFLFNKKDKFRLISKIIIY